MCGAGRTVHRTVPYIVHAPTARPLTLTKLSRAQTTSTRPDATPRLTVQHISITDAQLKFTTGTLMPGLHFNKARTPPMRQVQTVAAQLVNIPSCKASPLRFSGVRAQVQQRE